MPDGKPNPQQLAQYGAAQQPAGEPRGEGTRLIGPPERVGPSNPWSSYGLDPTQRQASGQRGNFKQATDGLNYYAQKKGKTISQQQWNELGQYSGYKGDDQVSGDMYNKGLEYLDKQWGQPEGPVVSNAPPDQSSGEQAITEWKKQAPAVGVPSNFRSNPLYGQQAAMVQQMMANPHTMGQQQQDQLAERQKESANRMMQQMGQQQGQQMAGRGFSGNSGSQQAMQQQNQSDMMQQILGGRRDIAMQAAQTNRQDELNALNASMGFTGQEYQQDMGIANMGLGQINQNRNFGLQEKLGNHGIDQDIWQRGFTKDSFNKTFGLDFLRYLQQGDQFNKSLGENSRQYNGQMGLNWANFDANQQNNFLNMLMGGWK